MYAWNVCILVYLCIRVCVYINGPRDHVMYVSRSQALDTAGSNPAQGGYVCQNFLSQRDNITGCDLWSRGLTALPHVNPPLEEELRLKPHYSTNKYINSSFISVYFTDIFQKLII